MHSSTLRGVLDHLRQLTDPGRGRELSDGDLLERFRRCREEAAFTLLLQRHGAMVLSACHRILGDDHAAEDAFQATFLVLVRKAGTIRKHASLSSWLHVVATHIAHKARMQSARRRTGELAAPKPIRNDNGFDALAAGELRAALDEEIARLPEKYRTPLILCYLAEKTHEQAAAELGWPKSSVTARLAKARELLQRRLRRRGFAVPAGLLAALLTETATNAVVPSLLTLSTVRLAMQAVKGEALAATSAAALSGGFVNGAAAFKAAGMLVLLATLGFAAALGYRLAIPAFPPPAEKVTSKTQAANENRAAKPEPRKPRVDLFGDALPEEALVRMGSSRLRHPFLRGLFFSPDGKSLVSTTESDLRIWDAASGKRLQRFAFDKAGKQRSCRLVGDHFVRALLDDKWHVTVQVIDAATGRIRRSDRIKDPAAVDNPTISPDGKWLAVAGQKEIRLYDTATGKMVQRLPFKGVAAWDIAFSPDSKTVAHNDLSTDAIYFHEVATGKLIRELKRPGDTTLRLVFSPDGRFLASMPRKRITEKGDVSIWNLHDGKELHRWTHPFPKAWAAAFSPDGKRITIGGVRWGLVLRDVETGKEVRRLNPHGGVMTIAFSPDGKLLATASPRGAIRLWDTATGKPLPVSADPDVQTADSLHFSADGKRLFGESAGACLIWDAATGRELQRISDPQPVDFKHPSDMFHFRLSPDESLLAAANADGSITLWDRETGTEKRVLKGGEGMVWYAAFTPDSRKLLANGRDGSVRVWDVETGRQLHQFKGQMPLTVSPDNRYMATGDAKTPTVFVYDLTTGRTTNRFALGTGDNVFQLTFAPDGRYLAAAGSQPSRGDGMAFAKVWSLADGQIRGSYEIPKSAFWCVAISPDGKSVATGAGNGALTLWELVSGRQRHAFVGHESKIDSVAFSPDGRSLAAASVDAPVYVWDVAGTLESNPRRLSNDELQRCWTTLAGEDAAAAFQAIRRLAAAPEQTLPFLRNHLQPVPAPDRKHVRQLVDMLDSADFTTRQKATEELEKQDEAASGLLRQIVDKEKPSLEVRRRLQQILESIDRKPESLRALRALEILEWIGSPDAVRFIGELAGGAAEARLTREAAAARKRLRR